ITDPGQIIGFPAVAIGVAKNVTHAPYMYVTPQMITQIDRQKMIEEDFRTGLENNEFSVLYQPKVDSDTNMIVGGEGLVRWIKDNEVIPPSEFVPVLERDGEVGALDLFVLERVCQDMVKWQESGVDYVPISVNFSRRDLSDPFLAEQIFGIIKKYDINPKYIQIEVTETIDEEEHGLMTGFLTRLRDLKISTAIDDFGSGYSSLSTLRDFKFSVLKIDRSFINNDGFTKNDEIIIKGIIDMAKALGIEVIVEGVERRDQLDFMRNLGCNIIQGFFYDEPLTMEQFTARLVSKVY
ncbi:MAG: EAL domain-containing protein, partial [Lachnospiraceae bacterium]|nr:EAL domain-containing protein [Lachnospiraceae bacterium]